ncbi:MAG TPA: GntR family transcriptional regulator [Symbiobacteriaceae bacterium]|nr:GntR family transcriptional regulator [Symbiobacteriaceae bacterium]
MATASRNRQPLYRQVAEEIRQAVVNRIWQPGARLPSEPDLARRYAVSRATVREALRVLEQDGVVVASRGQGTFVRAEEALPHVGINTLYSITEVIRQQGYTPSTTEIRLSRSHLGALGPAQSSATAAFAADEPVAVIERTRRADGRPVAYTQDAVPLRLLDHLHWEERVAEGSLFDLLREVGAEVDYTHTRLYAVAAPREAAHRLEVSPGAPLLMMEETVFDRKDRPVVMARDYYRTDRLEVLVIRDRNG